MTQITQIYTDFSHLRQVLCLVSCLLCLNACVEDITLPLQGGTKMLVVEGGLTTDTLQHKIILSLTNDFYDKSRPAPVSGATVTITDGATVYTLTEDTAGVYLTPPFAARVGATYRLDVHCGEGDFWSESSIDYQINPIDSVVITEHYRRENYLTMYIFVKDQAEIQNYYMGKVAVNDTLRNDSINRWFYIDDMYFNGRYIDGNFPVYSFKKEPDGEEDDYRVLQPDSRVTVYAYGISHDYYRFISEVNSSGSANPFMGPPAPPRTNIQPAGKACGFFYVASASRKSVVYLPKPDEPVMGGGE
ncbi:hypothetical protein FACS189434_04030 [Bacteroidia bacterium]|nr:hypothetical protein FACS189434_04030 [Bacteroidia bacterium]